MSHENRLQQFVQELLELNGAVVERPRENIMEVVFPPELAKKSSFEEYEKFYFDGETAAEDGKLITYQTDIFDSFRPMLQGRGLYTQLAVSTDYLKSSGFKEAIEESMVFTNGIFRFQKAEEKKISYLFVNFLYTAVSEDKKEGIFQQGINEYTLAGCEWPVPAEGPGVEGSVTWARKHPMEETFKRVSIIARSRVLKVLEDFKKRLNHYWNRDIRRLNEYYGTLIDEIQKKIIKKNLDGPKKEKELSRIQAAKNELKRKIRNQKDRYRLRVELHPINAIRIISPTVALSVTLHRKKKSREVEFVWNPFQKMVEPLSCESCYTPIRVFSLCDDRLHTLCKVCASCDICGKFHCRVCFPGRCKGKG